MTKEGLTEYGEDWKGLRDLNRISMEFGDPLLMALCFEVLKEKYTVYGLKNKYLEEPYEDPPVLHFNLDLGDGWLVEVQMLFRDILQIKKEQHKFYEVKRATGPWAVTDRLFKDLEMPEDRLRKKLKIIEEKLRKLESVEEKLRETELKLQESEEQVEVAEEKQKKAKIISLMQRGGRLGTGKEKGKGERDGGKKGGAKKGR